MMLLAAALLATPALAKTDWANTVAATPSGGLLIGNPAAKVKLVEFASYTCSHCKAFHESGLPALKAKYLATGNVSFEQRSFVRNGPDFSASLLVACQAPRPALAFAGKLFAEQGEWTKGFEAMTAADNQAISAMPPEQQPAEMATRSGLDRWADARGVPLARSPACLADKAAQARLLAVRNDALTNYKLEGTPTFGINGVPVPGVFDWAGLEPKLQAALKSPKP
ncbi:protein-disulfide isomerase [Polymorphobacter fuscus]|nr:protein-disulfide isomerase [Polymorphobacter fuscus]